jgi:hypothetical protein
VDFRGFINDRIKTAGRYVIPSIRQLILMDRHGEPGPVGSCVLLWHGGRRYVVSAAHVLDAFVDQPLFIGTATKWHQVIGEFTTTTPPAGKKREHDPHDYGFLEVSEADASQLDGCHFLTADQVARDEQMVFDPPYRSKYMSVGWPRNRLGFNRKERMTEPENIAFTGVIADRAMYVKHDRDPHTHILVEYDRKGMFGFSGDIHPPSLDGMSGGGVFTMPGLQRVGDVSPPRLVGITIELWADHKLYVGTRIDRIYAAVDAAAQHAPEAGGAGSSR